jgi:similar to stage IV sporulation protein
MSIVKLFHYINGFYIIEMHGYMMEKLLNILHIHKIYAWDIKKDKNGALRLKLMRGSLEKFLSLSKHFKVDVKVISKHGLPYFLQRMLRKKGFVIGCMILIASFFFLSSLILKIEIPVEYSMQKQQIMTALSEVGLKAGLIKYTIDYDEVKRQFLINNPDYTYISITLQGTKAKVDLYSAVKSQEIYDYSKPADIIASKDGEVTKILTIRGTALVKQGDIVKRGDVLISGNEHMLVGNSETYVYQCATGSIMAKVKYNFENIPVNMLQPSEDAAFTEQKIILLKNFAFEYKKADDSDDLIEYQSTERNIYLFDFMLPVRIQKIIFYKKSEAVTKNESKIVDDVVEYLRNNDYLSKNIQITHINIKKTGQYMDNNLYSAEIIALEEIAQIKYIQ